MMQLPAIILWQEVEYSLAFACLNIIETTFMIKALFYKRILTNRILNSQLPQDRSSQPFYDLVPVGHHVLSTRTTSSRTTNLIESRFIQGNNIN